MQYLQLQQRFFWIFWLRVGKAVPTNTKILLGDMKAYILTQNARGMNMGKRDLKTLRFMLAGKHHQGDYLRVLLLDGWVCGAERIISAGVPTEQQKKVAEASLREKFKEDIKNHGNVRFDTIYI